MNQKVLEMAELHLMNVEQEIRKLNDQKQVIDEQIQKLSQHLQTGAGELAQAKSKAEAELADSEAPQ